jgi:hypothetical protein
MHETTSFPEEERNFKRHGATINCTGIFGSDLKKFETSNMESSIPGNVHRKITGHKCKNVEQKCNSYYSPNVVCNQN